MRTEKFWLWLARKLPKKLRYWCVIDAGAFATSGKYETTNVPELSMMDMIDRLDSWGK